MEKILSMRFAAPIRCGHTVFDGARTYVMGVVNVTPDSFSDGGRYFAPEPAVEHALRLVAEGADLLDLGAESTRPGAAPVDEATEWARLEPVLLGLRGRTEVPLSVDTTKGSVARAALAAGVALVNDVSGGRDPELLRACADAGAPLVLGHLRGTPATMQASIQFEDVFEEVVRELGVQVERARALGVTQLIVDPGIGFGKTTAHNLELLARAGELGERLGLPVMVGPSRKAFLGQLTGEPPERRVHATLGAVVATALRGAGFVRVHDVLETHQALLVAEAIAAYIPGTGRTPGSGGDAGPQEMGRGTGEEAG